jgi:hypothetical protein
MVSDLVVAALRAPPAESFDDGLSEGAGKRSLSSLHKDLPTFVFKGSHCSL